MGLFGKKTPPPPPAPHMFDGIAGRERLDQLVAAFLARSGQGYVDPIADVASEIFAAVPIDPNARVGSDFFDSRWNWILAVARRAESDQSYALASRIGLMTEIWNRNILRDEPRYQMGRLPRVNVDTEQDIYRCALRSLARLEGTAVLVPGGESGWTVSEALGQLGHTLESMRDAGVAVDSDLIEMAHGDLAALGLPAAHVGGDITVPATDHAAVSRDILETVTQDSHDAERGDDASAAYLRGLGIQMNGGSSQEALAEFEFAAQRGHLKAMYDAGCLFQEMGDHAHARHWWQVAAENGHADSSWNLAAAYAIAGDPDAARPWYLRCGELGDPRGYGALTQMSRDANDDAGVKHWSRLGAELGEGFCQFFYGVSVMRDDDRTSVELQDAIRFLTQAAEGGDVDSMFMAGLANDAAGNRFEAGKWLRSAQAAGHPRAGEVIGQGGY